MDLFHVCKKRRNIRFGQFVIDLADLCIKSDIHAFARRLVVVFALSRLG